jgi:uroporphyrin-III C-methyltransferase/precorrin-2 dehydrogenase/sirohydrochlorin ferrochelatase
MIPALPLFHRIAGRPVMVLGEGAAAEAKRRLVERAGGIVVGEEDGEARLAFVALDRAEATVARLRARGILVNVVDRPELCDFTTPAILDRTPVLVAIGTGGASAGLAKALRLRLEALLPQRLGALAAALGAARDRLRGRWPDASERRRALDAALGEGGVLDPLREESADHFESWLKGGGRDPSQSNRHSREGGNPFPHAAPSSKIRKWIPAFAGMTRRVSGRSDHALAARDGIVEIRLRGDDPDDLTLREARLLGSVDVLAHEPGVPAAILDRARADAIRVALGVGEEAPALPGLVVVLRLDDQRLGRA